MTTKPLIPNEDFRIGEPTCPRCGKARRYELSQLPPVGSIRVWCGDERTECIAPRVVPDIRVGDYVHLHGGKGAHLVKSVLPHGVILADGITIYSDFNNVKLAWRPNA